MRIIHFVSSLGTGGAEVVVKDSVLSLNRLGHEVMVLVYESNESWPYEKMVREAGIPVECVGFEQTDSILKRAFRKLFRRSLIKKKLIILSFLKKVPIILILLLLMNSFLYLQFL